MNDADLKKISKQMSWILRHEAERLKIEIDPEGYVRIEDLVTEMRKTEPLASEEVVRAVVERIEARKQRYSIIDDLVRANYGHSLEMRIEQRAAVPPGLLYHGTTISVQAQILSEGLRPMRRQYAHLTTDLDLARQVGGRHGRPCVLRIDAMRAHEEGVRFFKANRSFWLVSDVPPRFISPG